MRVRITTEPQLGASYKDLLRVAQGAERWNFDGFFRSDHLMRYYGQGAALPGPSDAWTSLAALATETATIRLGTLVTPVTFRHPGSLAVIVAQVDAISGGRVELGLGAGWHEREHLAYGIPFPSLRGRFDRLEELMQILNAWWAAGTDEAFDYHGRYFELTGCPALPKPIQPRIPIILGGRGRNRTPLLAASFADEYNVNFGTPQECRQQFEWVLAACERIGRDPSALRWSTVVTVFCGENVASQNQRAARAGWDPQRLRSLPGRVIGSADEVTTRLAEYRAVGVDTLYLQLLDIRDLDHVALLGADVAPTLAKL